MTSHTIRIGIAGNKGSFSDDAASRYANSNGLAGSVFQYLYTPHRVLQFLNQHHIDLGIFALTNSFTGIILESLDAMAEQNFQVLDVFDLSVTYALLVPRGKSHVQIKTIVSHPSILDGCKNNLQLKYPDVALQPGTGILIDQSTFAEHLSESKAPTNVAVIASPLCAKYYGLDIIDADIADQKSMTTFVCCRA